MITAGPRDATLHRLYELVSLFVWSGMALVLMWFVIRLRDALRRQTEVVLALLSMTAYDGVGLLLSGSYWGSNLTALFPGTLLAVAVVTSSAQHRSRAGMKAAVCVTVASTLFFTTTWVATMVRGGHSTATYLGSRIGDASQPGDTIIVLYGAAHIVLATGLDTPYEHLWSLPMRTLDPKLDELQAVLAGPDAPTWVVPWLSPNSWGIDADGKVRALLAERYASVGRFCGHTVLLRKGLRRPALAPLDCRKPWR